MRRSSVISRPFLCPAGCTEITQSLSALIDDYHHALSVSPASSSDVLNNIINLAQSLNLPEQLDELEAELYRMNTSLIPKGLHAFGEDYTAGEAKEYVRGILRYSRNDVLSLRAIAARAEGVDMETLEEEKDYKKAEEFDKEADVVFDAYFEDGTIPTTIAGSLCGHASIRENSL